MGESFYWCQPSDILGRGLGESFLSRIWSRCHNDLYKNKQGHRLSQQPHVQVYVTKRRLDALFCFLSPQRQQFFNFLKTHK